MVVDDNAYDSNRDDYEGNGDGNDNGNNNDDDDDDDATFLI